VKTTDLFFVEEEKKFLKNLQENWRRKRMYIHLLSMSEIEEVQNAIASLPAEWKAIDILINNAGNAHGLEPLTEGKVSDWDMMMDGNVKGLLYVSKCIIPGMKERAFGHIINISSVAALQTYANGVVYCASKKQ
jgi:NADP-dependent 3-hydroxy acid dehydrogenase YdfG